MYTRTKEYTVIKGNAPQVPLKHHKAYQEKVLTMLQYPHASAIMFLFLHHNGKEKNQNGIRGTKVLHCSTTSRSVQCIRRHDPQTLEDGEAYWISNRVSMENMRDRLKRLSRNTQEYQATTKKPANRWLRIVEDLVASSLPLTDWAPEEASLTQCYPKKIGESIVADVHCSSEEVSLGQRHLRKMGESIVADVHCSSEEVSLGQQPYCVRSIPQDNPRSQEVYRTPVGMSPYKGLIDMLIIPSHASVFVVQYAIFQA